jgi:hypothetical protein
MGYSGQYLKDGVQGAEFVKYCAKLWEVLGEIYGKAFPHPARVLQEYQLPDETECEFLAKPWPGMTINRGQESPVESQPHKDKTDAFFSLAALFAFGTFTGGGNVVLWEQKTIITMDSGDALFLPAHLITHSNQPVINGVRHSLVAYARQETLTKDQNPNSIHDRKRKDEGIKRRQQVKKQKTKA